MAMPSAPAAAATSTKSFAHQAAQGSWVAAIVAVVANHMMRSALHGVWWSELIVMLFVLAGLVLAVVGLIGIRRHGRKSILVPALIGLLLNGLIVLIFVSNVMAYRAQT